MSIIEKALDKMKKDESDGKKGSSGAKPAVASASERSTGSAQTIPDIPPSVTSSSKAPSVELPPTAGPAQSKQSVSTATADVKIDLERLRALGMITPDIERSQIAEEYRLIKRPLLNNALGKGATVVSNGNLIMITSSLPGEGKTFCSINLAMSIALERDKTVLLVDADVAKPSINKVLGVNADKGLVDYLLGEVPSLTDVLLRTNVPSLSLLPAGKKYGHSTELLASESMRTLLQELSYRYPDRIVIFDSPPLLATSEASVLANQMGQVVAVVEAERTPDNILKDALGMIDENMIIGLILNKSGQLFGTDYYGSYGYGTYGT